MSYKAYIEKSHLSSEGISIGVLISDNNNLLYDWWHLKEGDDEEFRDRGIELTFLDDQLIPGDDNHYNKDDFIVYKFETVDEFKRWLGEKYFEYML